MKPAALRRAVERELIEGLAAGPRRSLIERLRGNPAQRRAWDRAIAGFRALEQREVAKVELEQVERWLFEDLADEGLLAAGPSGAPEPARRRFVGLATLLATLATATALLVWIDPEAATSTLGVTTRASDMIDEQLVARGSATWPRPLGLELVCGQPARPAKPAGCATDELLGFSVRLGDETLEPAAAAALAEAPLHLGVFGLSHTGELLYYTPTPTESARVTLELGEPAQALPLSVRLAVNHRPGLVHVYALASDAPLAASDVERLAAALRSQAPTGIDDPPWHLRLAPDLLGDACPRLDRCASAQAELRLINPPIPTEPREPIRTEP